MWLEPEDDENNMWLDIESHATPSVVVHVRHLVRLAVAVLWRVQSSLLLKLVAADWRVILKDNDCSKPALHSHDTDVLSILLI